jgi:hypothetical protein
MLGAASLAYLVIIHKLEYFLNPATHMEVGR